MTVTSMPSRSMSWSRTVGSVMPARAFMSARAVPFVCMTPIPIRFANCCLMRSRRAAMCDWERDGRRACQAAGSPPCPWASITKWPYLPIGSSLQGEDAARERAAPQVLERDRELVERVVARDELVDLEPPAEVEVGEHRKVVPRARGAVAAA